jgi:hypothetical protein
MGECEGSTETNAYLIAVDWIMEVWASIVRPDKMTHQLMAIY